MNYLIDIAMPISIACLFSVIVSLVTATLHQLWQFCSKLRSQGSQLSNQLPDQWLLMIILSALPFIYCALPILPTDMMPLNIDQLPLNTGLQNTVINSMNEQKIIHSIFGNDLLSLCLISWLMIWSCGSIYFIYRYLCGIKCVRNIIKNAQTLDDTSNIPKNHLKKLKRLHIQTQVDIRITQSNMSPFVFQWYRKYLILPQRLLADLNKQQLDLIIRHELTHIKKGDAILMLLVRLIYTVMWFNPIIKKFIQNMNCAIEIQCDNQVLSRQPHLRRTYARLMLKALRQSVTQTSNPMVTAFSIIKHRSITMRINNIMKASDQDVKLKNRKVILYGKALALACLTFIVQPQLQAASVNETSQWQNPVKAARISADFGAKNKFHKFHKGIDLAAKKDTPIVASASGKVRVSTDLLENRKNYGTIIIIDHDDGQHSVYYSHLNSRVVKKGEYVEAGQLIGYVGETGKATGPHLHLEVRKVGKHINPNDLINFN